MPPRPTISCNLYLPSVVPARASAGIILLNVGSRLNERKRNDSSGKHACAIGLFLEFSRTPTARRGRRHVCVRTRLPPIGAGGLVLFRPSCDPTAAAQTSCVPS